MRVEIRERTENTGSQTEERSQTGDERRRLTGSRREKRGTRARWRLLHQSSQLGFLLHTLDLTKLNAQRDVVKNERRQSYDNQPYGCAGGILSRATYPASNPYSWEVIGA